jgi:hypothetical protein
MDPATVAAISGGVGLLTSAFGGRAEKRRQERMKEDFANHQAQYDATAGQYGRLGEDFRAMGDRFSNMSAPELARSRYERGQAQFANMMQQAAAGQGPSQAQMQLQAGNDAAIANQMAMANSGRGNAMASQFNAARNSALLTQENARQAALLRQQEMMDARGLLASSLSGFRGQDIEAAQANQAAALQNRALNQQAGFGGLEGAGSSLAGQLTAQQSSAGLTQARYAQPSTGQALLAGGMQMVGDAGGMYNQYLMNKNKGKSCLVFTTNSRPSKSTPSPGNPSSRLR